MSGEDWRVRAARARVLRARLDLARAEAVCAASALAEAARRLSAAWQRGVDAEVKRHPDLAELDVAFDGWYGEPGPGSVTGEQENET